MEKEKIQKEEITEEEVTGNEPKILEKEREIDLIIVIEE